MSLNRDFSTAEEISSISMLINGQLCGARSGLKINVQNPANRKNIASVPRGQQEDVDLAVTAAISSFHEWRKSSSKTRGQALLRIADEIEKNVEALAKTLALETGNAIRTQSRPEVKASADVFRYFGGLFGEAKGESSILSNGALNYTLREPIGVVAAVIPWNSPIIIAATKIAPAICMGNTVVLKTAEDAPLAVLELANICSNFLPPGVLNVLTGLGAECGVALVNHPGVGKISFTGSTEVGKSVMRAAADRVVPVSLELGGKSPNIIFPDSNEDWVVDGTIGAARITRQSQSCTAGTRVFIHDSIFDSFVDKLAIKLNALKVGDPLDENTDIGALINQRQYDRICGYISEGLLEKNAKLITGGLPEKNTYISDGYFLNPTLFACDSNDWRLAREEIFGPVLCAIRWSDESEVLRMANDSNYGLAGFVWCRDINKAMKMAHGIEAGFIQINQGAGPLPGQSFGGYKQSGIGNELSVESMLETFTRKKNIAIAIR
jgi:acyl-CoA reductase-like NAD-dependent aldehyde dehydrogenase